MSGLENSGATASLANKLKIHKEIAAAEITTILAMTIMLPLTIVMSLFFPGPKGCQFDAD
jgi:hypothetical protein